MFFDCIPRVEYRGAGILLKKPLCEGMSSPVEACVLLCNQDKLRKTTPLLVCRPVYGRGKNPPSSPYNWESIVWESQSLMAIYPSPDLHRISE